MSDKNLDTKDDDADEIDDTRWPAIYASALVFTALFILAMWWFSRAFSS